MAQICANGLSILETALLCWKRLRNLTNGLNIFGMTYIMWEMA